MVLTNSATCCVCVCVVATIRSEVTLTAVAEVTVVGSTTVDTTLLLLSEPVGLVVAVIVVDPVDVSVDVESEVAVITELVVTAVADDEISVTDAVVLEVEPTAMIATESGAQPESSSPANCSGILPSASRYAKSPAGSAVTLS